MIVIVEVVRKRRPNWRRAKLTWEIHLPRPTEIDELIFKAVCAAIDREGMTPQRGGDKFQFQVRGEAGQVVAELLKPENTMRLAYERLHAR